MSGHSLDPKYVVFEYPPLPPGWLTYVVVDPSPPDKKPKRKKKHT